MTTLPIIPTAEMVTYLICLILPSFMFLIVALAKEKRRYKAPIYYGFVVAIIISIVLYILIPVIKNIISNMVV